jgi:hypothetical protein
VDHDSQSPGVSVRHGHSSGTSTAWASTRTGTFGPTSAAPCTLTVEHGQYLYPLWQR